MKKEALINYLECGREIEFKYKGKMYSITFSPADMDDFISFCEFYQEPTNVKTIEDVLKISRDGVTVLEMWESLSEDDAWIY
ncbi:MAG: hypothetical protein IJH61_07125 [Eubacteriaceae bacterium]|nr:hypothetical protein [Eubacteriaceae bacterium]